MRGIIKEESLADSLLPLMVWLNLPDIWIVTAGPVNAQKGEGHTAKNLPWQNVTFLHTLKPISETGHHCLSEARSFNTCPLFLTNSMQRIHGKMHWYIVHNGSSLISFLLVHITSPCVTGSGVACTEHHMNFLIKKKRIERLKPIV